MSMKNAEKSLEHTKKVFLFGQTTKQLLSNFELWKPWKYKQLWALGPDPSWLSKKCILTYQMQ